MATVALGWQVYEMTGSAFHLGLIGLAQFLPVALLVFFAGHAADRYDRQRVVQVCQVAQAIAAAFLCWGSYEGWLTVPAIYGAVALLGVATAFESPATAALLTGVAPRGQFQRAAALSTGMFQVAVISGPALGGFAYAVGPALPYAIMAAFWLIGSVLNGAIRLEAPAGDRPQPRLGDLFAGIALRAQRQGDPRDDLARPLRGAPRRRDGADADLRPRHPAHRPLGPRRAARGAGGRRAGDDRAPRPPQHHPPGRACGCCRRSWSSASGPWSSPSPATWR